MYWNEGRPNDGGRQVIVSVAADQAPADVIPPGFSARSQVQEYGGRCYAVAAGGVIFSNWADQRLWLVHDDRGAPSPLTPEPEMPRSERFADPIITPDGRWVICVHEHHEANGHVDNDIVAIPLDPPSPDQPPRIWQAGHDFYGAPRVSPDGTKLAWIAWDHPNMPWDHTELWVAQLTVDGALREPVRVRGDEGESITQPRWSPTGVLHYVSDQTGWWNLYDEAGTNLCPMDAEFGVPDWVFGNATYGFLPDGQLVALWTEAGQQRLGLVTGGKGEPLAAGPFSHFEELQPSPSGGIVAMAASPTSPPAVVGLDLNGGSEVLRRSREVPIDEDDVSTPRAVEFPTGGGETAHALFYPPRNAGFDGARRRASPADRDHPRRAHVVHRTRVQPVHPVLDHPRLRGGRRRLPGQYRLRPGLPPPARRGWGIVDVEDCARRGGMAGRSKVWSTAGGRLSEAGAPAGSPPWPPWPSPTASPPEPATTAWPTWSCSPGTPTSSSPGTSTAWSGPGREAADEYHRRSPIHHVDQITCPLILFQGLEDQIVPPGPVGADVRGAPRAGACPSPTWTFEGEQHGFRQAATIMAVAAAELAFYGRVFGFTPATGRHRQSLPWRSPTRTAAQPSSLMACLGQRCTASLHLGAQLLGRVLLEHVHEVVVANFEHLRGGGHAQGVALTKVVIDYYSHAGHHSAGCRTLAACSSYHTFLSPRWGSGRVRSTWSGPGRPKTWRRSSRTWVTEPSGCRRWPGAT